MKCSWCKRAATRGVQTEPEVIAPACAWCGNRLQRAYGVKQERGILARVRLSMFPARRRGKRAA